MPGYSCYFVLCLLEHVSVFVSVVSLSLSLSLPLPPSFQCILFKVNQSCFLKKKKKRKKYGMCYS